MNAPSKPAGMFAKHSHEMQPQTFEEILAAETRPVPDYINNFGTAIEGPYKIPTRWYTNPAVHTAEIEGIWKRKWQFACRVDHLAEKGDTFVYKVAGLSFVLVRVSKDEIKAYWNSCLHRGVPLRQCAGRVDRLQCPFHGFTWGLDGKSQLIPHDEEFPHIDKENFSLPEVNVAIWQDFVFINPDLDAEPLETYLGALDGQFQRFPYTNRELAIHVTKVFPANWKVVQEAFMESYHVLTTHPQFAACSGGERCNDFTADGNVSRSVLANGVTSDYIAKTPSEADVFRILTGWWDDEEVADDAKLPEGRTARSYLADQARGNFRAIYGDEVDYATDTELIDVYDYTVFPNTHIFGMLFTTLVYRFLPYGENGDKCTMEVFLMMPMAEGQQAKPPAAPIWLNEDQEFVAIEELGTFGAFISQDSSNMAGMMMGLRSSKTGFVQFSRKLESKIRHFYALFEESLGLSAEQEVAAIEGNSS